jgi:hypothetical protein
MRATRLVLRCKRTVRKNSSVECFFFPPWRRGVEYNKVDRQQTRRACSYIAVVVRRHGIQPSDVLAREKGENDLGFFHPLGYLFVRDEPQKDVCYPQRCTL